MKIKQKTENTQNSNNNNKCVKYITIKLRETN